MKNKYIKRKTQKRHHKKHRNKTHRNKTHRNKTHRNKTHRKPHYKRRKTNKKVLLFIAPENIQNQSQSIIVNPKQEGNMIPGLRNM